LHKSDLLRLVQERAFSRLQRRNDSRVLRLI
jgi:hypothetical protein